MAVYLTCHSVLTMSDVDSVSQRPRVGHGPSLGQIPTGFHGASATQCLKSPTMGGSGPRCLSGSGSGRRMDFLSGSTDFLLPEAKGESPPAGSLLRTGVAAGSQAWLLQGGPLRVSQDLGSEHRPVHPQL